MSYGSSQVVLAKDFNDYIQVLVSNYAGGSGDRGYGQSGPIIPVIRPGQDLVTAEHWTALATMLSVCARQTGTALTGISLDPRANLRIEARGELQPSVLAIDTNRLSVSSDARTLYPDLTRIVQDRPWNGILDAHVSVDFGSSDNARHFFNAGGEIRFALTHPSGSSGLNDTWRTLLQDTIGAFVLSASKTVTTATTAPTDGRGYYALEDVEQIVLSRTTGTVAGLTEPASVTLYGRRGSASPVSTGNGAVLTFRLRMTCKGTAQGGALASDGVVAVSVLKADRYLKGIVTPTISASGFALVAAGVNGVQTPNGIATVVTALTQTYPADSTRQFTVPHYAILTCDLKGAGGSEASSLGPQPRSAARYLFTRPGAPGHDASIAELNLVARGGGGGSVYRLAEKLPGLPGNAGSAEGGDSIPGGGGLGGRDRYVDQETYLNGSAGGSGGRVVRSYIRGSIGAPVRGAILTVATPRGGTIEGLSPSNITDFDYYPGNPGGDGDVTLSWTTTTTGSTAYALPGTYPFVIPEYTTITFTLAGAGGGQSGYVVRLDPTVLGEFGPLKAGTPGGAGGTATITGITGWTNSAGGGQGGRVTLPSNPAEPHTKVRGDNGTGTGGTVTAGGGAKGGVDGYLRKIGSGTPDGGAGGDGALVVKTFARSGTGSPVPGATVQCVVPSGGTAGLDHTGTRIGASEDGHHGFILIAWA